MENIFADTAFGKAALEKLSPVEEGFMLFECGWVGKTIKELKDNGLMKCTGAVFREAKNGKNKGKRTVIVKGTERSTFITRQEILRFSEANGE